MRLAEPELAGAFDPLALEVHFQPKVSLVDTRTPVAFEALFRGRRSNGHVVGTKDAFAMIASKGVVERGALRSAVALSMIERAARAAAILRAGVAVNVEPDMLANAAFLEAASRIAPGLHPITLEVIEEATTASMGALASGVAALRGAGFRVALDDFGIAESNLMRLTRLTVDEVKIDAALLDFGRGRAMLPHLVAAIRAVGAQACIEGIETPEHHAIALASGADLGQGYLYGPPAPIRPG